MVKGISFDFWDTLFKDDSDEEKRKQLGLRSKPNQRLQLMEMAFSQEISRPSLSEAIKLEKRWFEEEWKGSHRTPRVRERLEKICSSLNISVQEESFNKLVLELENIEVKVQPEPFEGCLQTLKELRKHYKLGITSDTIFTPGSGIRKILKDNAMLDLFEGFSFSDEVGVSKPHKDIFLNTLDSLKLAPHEVVHIGDRLYNDVSGAKKCGMKSIWLNNKGAGRKGRFSEKMEADFEVQFLNELPLILKKMNS